MDTAINDLFNGLPSLLRKLSSRRARQFKMLCLVSLPNGFLLEIALSPKARGQECLDKVPYQKGDKTFGYTLNSFIRLSRL